MKVADLQKYLRALADAVGAAKGSNKELTEAADALTPFGNHSMADFASFLQLAESTYRETGKLPIAAAPKARAPKKAAVTAEQLQEAIRGFRDRIQRNEPLTRATVAEELARFESLTKPTLDGIVSGLGYQVKPKTKKAAMEMIAERLLAGAIAGARSEI